MIKTPRGLGIEACSCELGLGIFAARDFQPGEKIVELTGPKVTYEQVLATDTMGNPLQIGASTYLDLQPPGVWFNHSCDPNSGILDDGIVIARVPISVGEEIRWDYSTSMDEDDWTLPCECGSRNCRGVVRDFKDLPEAVQNRYLAEGIVMSFIAEQHLNRLTGSRVPGANPLLSLPR